MPLTHNRNGHQSHDGNASTSKSAASNPKSEIGNSRGLIMNNALPARAAARLSSITASFNSFVDVRLLVTVVAIALVATVLTTTAYMQSQDKNQKPGATRTDKDVVKEEIADKVDSVVEPTEALALPSIGDYSVLPFSSSTEAPDLTRLSVPLAPLTGTKNIPGDYATLAAAITDLNAQGVGVGGVTFNVIAGNPQTAPVGGYVIGGATSLVLTSSSAANPIVFTGNSNTVTAGTPQAAGTVSDAVIKLVGADFVTIQGFTIQENAGNVVLATSGTNTMTEFGVALFYVTATDGAKNNTIQNNTITLNRAYATTIAIFSTTRTTSTSMTVTAEATSTAGTNTNNKFYGNNISNTNYAIALIGVSTAALQETGNDIGGAAAGTGNTITNYSTGTAQLSSIVGLTGSNAAIYSNHQINDNISFNSITSAALTSLVTQTGIFKNYATTSATGTFTTTINNNTVTITNNPSATTTGGIIGIANQGLTPLLATATMSVNSNTVQNCVLGGATSTTNGLTAISNTSLAGTVNMTGNNVINNAITATTATSGALVGVVNSAAAGTVNLTSNVVRNLSSTATTGQVQGIANSGAVTTAINITNNQLGNATGGFYSSASANTGALFGAVNSNGASGALLTMTGNDIRGITYTGAASASQNYYNNQVYTGSTNISSNTITNITVNTTGGVTMISNSVTHAASTTHNVNNNSIVTAFSKTAAGGSIAFYNSFGSSPSTVTEINTGNNFSNVTFTGATAFIGWRSADGTTPGSRKTVTTNTFSNITGGTSALTSVLYVGFGDNTFANNNVSGNVISNVSAAASIDAIFSDGQNQNFFGNTINTLNSTGGAAVVRAFNLAGATTQNVFKNKIYDLQATDAAGTVNGILISAGTTFNVYNNLIGDLRTPAANTANPLIGINITGGTTVGLFFNTVYLNATSSGSPFGSSGISASTTPTLTLADNVFVNTSTPAGAGLSVAYRRSSTTLTTYASGSNNNDFFASTIFNDGTNTDSTIAAYKTRVTPRDSASFSENPPFLSTTGSSANFLHINPATPTQLESGGTPVGGITDDFDGQTRNVSTPDVGADEFAGIALDLTAPTISYTPIGNTLCTTAPTLSATITDGTGVNTTAGTKPRLYFKKSGDANTFAGNTSANNGWKFVEATNSSSPFSFTLDYSLLQSAVVATDVIQYFVVAQDTAPTPNVGINSGVFNATPSSVALTAAAFPITGTINQFTILSGGLSGTVTIGAAGTYTSLTGAGGLFAAINSGGLSGDLTANIVDTSVTENGTNALNAISYGCATYTLTIKPGPGVISTLTGSSTGAIITLNAADRVILDGSNNGSTTRDLTIINTNIGTSSALVWLQNNGADGATNNTIKNVNIVGSGNTQTLFGIGSGSSTISTASLGTGNNTNTIQNNNISKTQYGIYSQGASIGTKNTGNAINQNLINTASPNNVQIGGIMVGFENNITISQNNIAGMSRTSSVFGIAAGFVTSDFSATVFTGNEVTNATISRNKVDNLSSTSATGFSGMGIAYASAATGTTQISNNMISRVSDLATSPDFNAGIYVGGGTGTLQIYHNSVWLSGNRGAATLPSFALAIGGSTPIVDIQDNALENTSVSTGAGKSYAIGLAYTSTVGNYTNLISNNNGFSTSGTSAAFSKVGSLTQASGTDKTTLLAWQTETGRDPSPSFSGDPQFNSVSDLHIKRTPLDPSPVENVGTLIAAAGNDFDNDTRANPPDIGADEVTTMQFSSPTYSVAENVGGGLVTITVTRTAGTGNAGTVNYATSNGTATGGATCTGATDYITALGLLSFAAGETSKTFDITICNDAVFEGSETVNLTLSTPTGSILGTPNTAVLTIADDESPLYTWTGTANSDWQVPLNWTPTRLVPAANDVMVINGTTTPAPIITNVPTQTIAALRLINGAAATLNASAIAPPQTLTINGATGTDLTVPFGNLLTLDGVNGLTIKVSGVGTIGTIGGGVIAQTGFHRLFGDANGVITFQSGGFGTAGPGLTSNMFGTGAGGDGAAGSVIFASGSNYFHNAGGSPFGVSPNPAVVVFQTGSLASFLTASGFEASGRTYADLAIGKSDPSGVAVNASHSGSGNFQVDNLTLNSTSAATSSLTFTGSGASAINLRGNITSTGAGNTGTLPDVTLTPGSGGTSINKIGGGTIIFSSAGNARAIDLEGGATVNNGTTLSLARVVLLGLSNPHLNTLTVDTTAGISGGATGYVVGSLLRAAVPNGSSIFPVGTAGEYSPVDLDNASGGGSLKVAARTPQQTVLAPATSLHRYWTLTEGGAGITTDLTFHYLESDATGFGTESNYRLVVVELGNATSFPEVCPAGPCVDETANTIKQTGVQTFSDWTAAEPNAPTAVKLAGFSAVRTGDDVMLSWQSGYEARNLGYNIYREQDGKRVQITPSLVAGSALIAGRQTRLTAGLNYTWYDQPGAKGNGEGVKGTPNSELRTQNSAVTYWLEDVDLNGTRTLHGPIAVTECGVGNADCKKHAERSRKLSEVTNQQAAISNRQSGSGVQISGWPVTAEPAAEQAAATDVSNPIDVQRQIAGLPGLKISVSRAGWYRITQPEIVAAGLDVADSKYFQLYRDGRPVALRFSDWKDEFMADGYLEFYGEGSNSTTDRAQTYYLVKTDAPGKRTPVIGSAQLGEPSGPQSFAYTIERKERMVYFSGLLNGDGENFFGQILSSTPTIATMPVNQLDPATGDGQLEVVVQGVTNQSHLVQVRFNGIDLGTINFANTAHPSQTFSVPAAALREGNNSVELTTLGGAADISLVDSLRLTYQRTYNAANEALIFSVNSDETKRITGFNDERIRIFDITDPLSALELKALVSSDGESFRADVQLSASANSPHTLVAVSEGQAAHVDGLALNQSSSWWSQTAGADYLIITPRDLMFSVEPLALLHRSQGMVVQVVDVEDLYDEFTFGEHSPRAIHDFLQRASATWTRQPHYVLLAGDASYDPKNYFGQGLKDLVPTKLIDTALTETASDDWLADFNNDGIADLSLGRLPVKTVGETDAMVGKIVSYANMTPDPSRGALLVADTNFEAPSSVVQSLLPSGMTVTAVNRSSADDATIHNQIVAAINQGPRVTNYLGHGSNGVWTGASLLSNNDAPTLTNTNRLSVFTMMTCFNGYFQDAYNDSLSEALLKAPGGAVAVWASTTLTEPNGQNAIDQEFYRLLFGAQPATLGDAARGAKTVTSDADVRRTWTLFGDPAMRLR